jgi:hypothetical protein
VRPGGTEPDVALRRVTDQRRAARTIGRTQKLEKRLVPTGTRVLLAEFGDGSTAITAGEQGDVPIPFPVTISGWVLVADQAGDIEIDIWKDVYANFPPDVADSIVASAPPTLSSADSAEDTMLTGWTTAVAAGDVLRFNVNSASIVTRAMLALTLET